MIDMINLLKNIAPTLASALVGENTIVGSAAKSILNKIFGNSENAINKALNEGLTAEQAAKIKEAENNFLLELEKLKVTRENNFLLDVQSARDLSKSSNEEQKQREFRLGCVILITFAAIIFIAIFSCVLLQIKDPTIFGLLGSVLGYAAANAQQVVGFYFGSSSGSDKKTEMLQNMLEK